MNRAVCFFCEIPQDEFARFGVTGSAFCTAELFFEVQIEQIGKHESYAVLIVARSNSRCQLF